MTIHLDQLRNEAKQAIESAATLEALQEVENLFFGRKGKLTDLMKGIRDIPAEERKAFGQNANKLKQELSEIFADKQDQLSESASGSGASFDITRPGIASQRGGLHPVTQLMYDINDAFHSLGFEVYEGPEVSSEGFAFDSLNFPDDHPARESMDTYWLAGSDSKKSFERLCLRPHLTGGSVRYMKDRKPPFRFVYPGRVYRNESTDASHERAFYQWEALMVDKHVPFSSGRLMVNAILERVFGREVKTRMRAGFFPFVEPGFEIDMECLVCEGKGCSVCGQSGWVEMMPGGPPHPNVLRAAGVNSD